MIAALASGAVTMFIALMTVAWRLGRSEATLREVGELSRQLALDVKTFGDRLARLEAVAYMAKTRGSERMS